jgi:hyperosmotically inducible protein
MRPLALLLFAASLLPGVACAQALQQFGQRLENRVEQAVPAAEDALITSKVKGALIAAPEVSGLAVDVDTSGNVVTLRGTVKTPEQRQRAEQVARGVEGVREVRNELEVERAPTTTRR